MYRSPIIVEMEDTANAWVADLLYSIGVNVDPIILPNEKNVCNTPILNAATQNTYFKLQYILE